MSQKSPSEATWTQEEHVSPIQLRNSKPCVVAFLDQVVVFSPIG